MNIIEARNIYKSYGKVEALSDLNLVVPTGSIFALLGPNGAGKTTFVKTLLDLSTADRGEIFLNGKLSTNNNARVGVAYLPEKFSFFKYYTVYAVAEYFGKMKGLSKKELDEQIPKALERLKIFDIKDKKLKEISKGQMQRVGISNLFIGNNSLLILDEPFSGLDPIGVKELKDLLIELRDEGKTVFINSHILSEMEKICDHIVILNKGRTLAQGGLKELIGEQTLENFFYEKVNND